MRFGLPFEPTYAAVAWLSWTIPLGGCFPLALASWPETRLPSALRKLAQAVLASTYCPPYITILISQGTLALAPTIATKSSRPRHERQNGAKRKPPTLCASSSYPFIAASLGHDDH